VTSAEVHDSQAFESLLDKHNTKHVVYADSAYRSEEAEAMPRKKGYVSRAHYRAWGGQTLNASQTQWSRARSKIRARVDHNTWRQNSPPRPMWMTESPYLR